MKRRALAVIAAGLAVAEPLGAYTTVTDQHADLDITYVAGALSGRVDGDLSGPIPRQNALLYDGPVGTTGLTSPGGEYSFLGVAEGETIYVWPQDGEPDRIYLGFAAESIATGALQSYFESDARVAGTGAWIKIALADVRYHAAPGESGPAHFSLWQTDSFGSPTVWMSTAENGITTSDATWLISGGHSHYNWGFSKRGYYEVDFILSAYQGGTGDPLQSQVQTFHFGVEFQPTAIPEPSALALLGGTGLLLLLRSRHRRA